MPEQPSTRFALIAGSGFGSFANDAPVRPVTTRFGLPSAPVRELRYSEQSVFVLLRHGERHEFPPHRINYRANLQALKLLGATHVISLNTVGAIDARYEPGQLAVPDQLIDYTWGRVHTLYDDAQPGFDHVDFSEPFSAGLREALVAAAGRADAICHDGGVYGVTQGPRLETAAEVDRCERDGVHLLGMTAMPEAVLARELDMQFAVLSLIVNQAAGRGSQSIHADIEDNTMNAKMQAMRVLQQFFSAVGQAAEGS